MTIRHLKVFITVAECGKMNLAAKELYISQPSVSQVIAELERHYGVKLFERLSQKLYVTESGEQLLSYARHVVDSFESMDSKMKHSLEHPRIRLGASVSVGTCLLQDAIQRAEQAPENMDIRVTVNNTAYIETLILTSQLDIAVVEGMVSSPDMVQIPLCKDELVIVVGKQHPFYNRDKITLEELRGQGVAAREDGSMTRNQYEQLLLERGISLEVKWTSTNTEAIKNAVVFSRNIAILSKIVVEEELKKGILKVVTVENTQVVREMKMIFHKNKFRSKPLERFQEILRETIRESQENT